MVKSVYGSGFNWERNKNVGLQYFHTSSDTVIGFESGHIYFLSVLNAIYPASASL